MTDENQDFAQDSVVDTAHTQATEHEIDGANPNSENPDAEKTPEQLEQEKEQEQKKRQSNTQKRIAELTYQREQAKRELEAYKAAHPVQQQDSAKPTPDQFETWAEFEEAKDAWLQEQAEKRILDKLKAEQQPQGQSEYQAQLEHSVNELRTQYTDFDDVLRQGVERANSVPLPVDLETLGLPPKDLFNLAYTLSKDEDLYYELASMTPQQAMLRLGQVIASNPATASAPPVPKAPPVSKAPPPIKPVSANAPAARDPNNMSIDEWMKQRNSELKKR